jgi:hypothetical protein
MWDAPLEGSHDRLATGLAPLVPSLRRNASARRQSITETDSLPSHAQPPDFVFFDLVILGSCRSELEVEPGQRIV